MTNPRPSRANAAPREIWLVASGDLRPAANQQCWPAQAELESEFRQAIEACGWRVRRAHRFDPARGHGFIDSQRMGMEVFRKIPAAAPLVVAEAVWQYSHHVLPGLTTHRGPILTLANWSGTWPGLVGMLNLNGSLTKAGVRYSSLWGEDYRDPGFLQKLSRWLETGKLSHSRSHVAAWDAVNIPATARRLGDRLASQLQSEKAIMGVFDEGCMGMFNAIIPDHLLNSAGVFKERLSQSALYHETTCVTDKEAAAVRRWLEAKGMKFETGPNQETDLTDEQVAGQCKMYVAALRIADDFGCDTIGIQYQQGLKDLLPASDLVEGLLNNASRPPVRSRDGRRVLYPNQPLPHFNEVDECAGLDGLMTFRIHSALGQPVENTLHDLRWGDYDQSGSTQQYVWVFLISGAVPPAHLTGGYRGATSLRQPPMYFPSGGGTIQGVSRPGQIVWSRIYIENNRLKMDLGRGEVVKLPAAETRRRLQATTPQWPIMHAVTWGVSRDQMMGRHKSNHIQVAYATTPAAADRAYVCESGDGRCTGHSGLLLRLRPTGTRMEGPMNASPVRPTAEIVAIGDELTSGQRLDTNSQWLSRQFCDLGIPVVYHTTVADDADAMQNVFRVAIERADLVITTGGLGPTADDLTRDVIAAVAGIELELHQPSLDQLHQRYVARGREMPENNRRQAMFPRSSIVIPNPRGTAPGIEISLKKQNGNRCRLYALPGVPAEMKPMFQSHVVPSISQLHPQPRVIVHRSLHCFGAGESDVEMQLPDLIRRGQKPAVGITASAGTITLRIAAEGRDRQECLDLIEPVEQRIRETLGDLVFGESGQTLQDVLVQQLSACQKTLAVVDGGVGGLLGLWLHAADPEGRVFRGGISNVVSGDDDLDFQLQQAQQVTGADYVLLVGPDRLTDQASKRQIGVLHDQRVLRHSIAPLRDSTISVPHSAKQALNFLRNILNRPGQGELP